MSGQRLGYRRYRPGVPPGDRFSSSEVPVAERAVAHVRKFLGQRLRALRKQRALSQERLGSLSGLSGKFIGEVERGEKSISIDSLYHVAVALEVPLRLLTDVRAGRRAVAPSEDAEKIFALVEIGRASCRERVWRWVGGVSGEERREGGT